MDASSPMPRKSPRLIELAESQKLEPAGDKRKRQEDASSSMPHKSPRLIVLAESQKLEHARENDRAARLEKQRVRDKERRAALTEEEKEIIHERSRIAYQKQKQRTAGGKINNIKLQTSTVGDLPSTSSTSHFDRLGEPGQISGKRKTTLMY